MGDVGLSKGGYIDRALRFTQPVGHDLAQNAAAQPALSRDDHYHALSLAVAAVQEANKTAMCLGFGHAVEVDAVLDAKLALEHLARGAVVNAAALRRRGRRKRPKRPTAPKVPLSPT